MCSGFAAPSDEPPGVLALRRIHLAQGLEPRADVSRHGDCDASQPSPLSLARLPPQRSRWGAPLLHPVRLIQAAQGHFPLRKARLSPPARHGRRRETLVARSRSRSAPVLLPGFSAILVLLTCG
jgi:hypothetical protein